MCVCEVRSSLGGVRSDDSSLRKKLVAELKKKRDTRVSKMYMYCTERTHEGHIRMYQPASRHPVQFLTDRTGQVVGQRDIMYTHRHVLTDYDTSGGFVPS